MVAILLLCLSDNATGEEKMTIEKMLSTKQTVKMLITPQDAIEILNKHNAQNRNMRQMTVQKYASDMKNGCWFENGQSQWIGFYEDGNLADGQHRLMALVNANVEMYFNVEFGISKKAALGIDNHAARKMVDQIQIQGESKWICKNIVAMCRIIMEIESSSRIGRSISTSDVISFAENHKDMLIKARSAACSTAKYLSSAYIKVAVFYALHHEKEENVFRFCKVLFSGIYDSVSDISAARLREKLLTSPELNSGGGSRIMGVRIVMRVISAFCKGQDLKKIYTPNEYYYTLDKAI